MISLGNSLLCGGVRFWVSFSCEPFTGMELKLTDLARFDFFVKK